VAAISGSAQQHGSVYLAAGAPERLGALDPSRPLVDQLSGIFARPLSPVWMDTSTREQCRAIADAVGGPGALALLTGSRAFERFTGPQIRRFSETDPDGYARTARVHLVSSFMASLVAGVEAPIEPGDGSGMNLMDIHARDWAEPALRATAPDLARRLPPIRESWTIVGPLAPFFQARYGLPAAQTVAWTGDNPSSLIGCGLTGEDRLTISLGTSDTVFGAMDAPRVDPSGTGHVFGSPTGRYMGLTCFLNGSLARERVRDAYRLGWPAFSDALRATPPGNRGALLLPWFDPEITPPVSRPGVRRKDLDPADAAANVRAVVEGQMLGMKRHSAWMRTSARRIHATGGAAVNREILQVMADVFGAEVHRLAVGNSAALGAALRAAHADAVDRGERPSWEAVVAGLTDPLAGSRVSPDPAAARVYQDAERRHAEFEAEALRDGQASA
jgi:xylulokinase